MNKQNSAITRIVCHLLVFASAVLLGVAFLAPNIHNDAQNAAEQMERRLSRRLDKLEKYSLTALNSDVEGWIDLKSIPEDMVIYRYRNDTLQSWVNEFPVGNDELASKNLFQTISNPRFNVQSPLSLLSEKISMCDMGGRWYLAKRSVKDNVVVVSGLELTNSLNPGSLNGVNPRLHLSDRFIILPLSYSEGSAVSIDGVPLFKLICDSHSAGSDYTNLLVWIAFALILAAAITFVARSRTIRSFQISSLVTVLSSLAVYLWGITPGRDFNLFSPTLYSGGRLLYSLGAVILINLVFFLLILFLYMCRRAVFKSIRTKVGMLSHSALLFLVAAGIIVYIHYALKSIVVNSNICLEVFKFRMLSVYSLLVYISFLTLLSTLPMILQMLRPAIYRLTGLHVNAFSTRGRSAFSMFCAIYLVTITSMLSFRKEENLVSLWANRLVVDRDIMLEINLKQTEGQIASDALIPALAEFSGGEQTIAGRLTDLYLGRLSSDYDISVILDNGSKETQTEAAAINSLIRDGKPIYYGSHFLYNENAAGRYRYDGVFIYFNRDRRFTRLLVEIVPKLEKSNGGYLNLVGSSLPGKVVLPSEYSYARYSGDEIKTFSGNYAYPIVMDDNFREKIDKSGKGYFFQDGFIHFVTKVDDYETVIISRERYSPIEFFMSAVLIVLAMFFPLAFFNIGRRKEKYFEKNYYKKRLEIILMSSLTITLVGISVVSVVFVFKRNESNLNTILSERINSIQALVQNGVRGIQNTDELRSEEVSGIISNISSNTDADISLFSPQGRVFLSTKPQVFDALILSTRMDGTAFNNIVNLHKRYYFQKERLGAKIFYDMYAPVLDAEGNLCAIIATPYTTENYDFEQDAIMHTLSILAVFIMLISISRFLSKLILGMMFRPLSEMSRKMDSANLGNLEHINYSRDDEVASLVKAYNTMVDEMSASSIKLAQAERDKAWSGMARQVAHEIKNPLTPMKLQLQRLIRLKERNAPDWQDKFDEVAKILLDHIEILTGTANEFSTFAKLYTEEHTEIDLDQLLQEEISMFDGKEGITFDYIGYEGAKISGPRPQLVRVFVNLLTNSVQALEGENGRGDGEAKIMVSLRKSADDGYYDVVVEDNGPGVAPDNVEKLFTPNFTTKNGGSGLGLAISRSILENCNATISYSKSFTLGGACFTVHYPTIG